MIETTTAEDRAGSLRRIFWSDGFVEFEMAITMRKETALPDEPFDFRVTGEIPQNGGLADALVEIAARLNRHRCALALPEEIARAHPILSPV